MLPAEMIPCVLVGAAEVRVQAPGRGVVVVLAFGWLMFPVPDGVIAYGLAAILQLRW